MFEIKDLKFKHILDIPWLKLDRTIVCLTGPSGCGKSTLLRMLNVMETPDKGSVFYNGNNLGELDVIEHRRQVTMLPQTPVIYEGSIRDNLLIGLKLQSRPLPDDADLHRAMKNMHLQLKLDSDAGKLSGGEKQRLCLARIFLLDSPVYLLDEPSAALDPANERSIMDWLISYIRQEQKQLIMVTHAVDLAEEYADQLIRMKDGRVVEGEPNI